LSPTPVPVSPLALVLPCYNPPANWTANIVASLARFEALLPEESRPVHLYVINDGSAAVTPEDIQFLQANLPSFTYLTYPLNRGKGYALRAGISQVTEPLCMFTDIDFPYEETSMAKVYNTLRAGSCDVAVGSRDEAYYAQVPASRVMISKLLRRSTRLLLGLAVSDTQCGLKGFNQQGREVFMRGQIDRYLFDLEFIFLASRSGEKLRLQAVPVRLKPDIIFSRMSPKILLNESGSFLKILLARFL
jgi:glycosyltransferase involved in cell wall biosynthesis